MGLRRHNKAKTVPGVVERAGDDSPPGAAPWLASARAHGDPVRLRSTAREEG